MNVFDVSLVTDVCPRKNLQDEEAVTNMQSYFFPGEKTVYRSKKARLEFEFSYNYHITVELPLT